MSDDDLIRDAVHELVAASPSPKPLPMGGASSGGPYRWLAVAAAVILVIGGIVAIAWTQSDDDAPPVATTAPPLPTPPPETVVTSTPAPTSPATVPAPPSTGSAPVESTSSTTSTTTTTSTSTTTTTTSPPTPEQAQLQDYLAALAEGRYDDAAVPLNEGGLELEGRADLRPLFTEYGDVDDLPGRLKSWCENEAICSQPDTALVDIGGYWMATWAAPGGAVTGYFRSGSFEGSPSVGGLPPRRPSRSVVGCPTRDVTAVREADLDGDGVPETIVATGSTSSGYALGACNTALEVPPLTLPSGNLAIGVLQPASDPAATLLIGTAGESSTCGATYRLAASAGALVQVGWEGCWGGTGESIGCRDVNGESSIVTYRYSFVGGDRLDNSTAMNVDVLSLDGAPLESFTLTLPDQSEEGLMIVEPYCNGLPVITFG